MKLALSSAACRGLELARIASGCRRRGLEGIELAVEAGVDVASRAAALGATETRLIGLRAEGFDVLGAAALALASGELGVPVSVPLAAIGGESLASLSRLYDAAGGTLLLGVETSLKDTIELVNALGYLPPSVGIAWELRPRAGLGEAGAVLLAARERLKLVRLHGGGPEQRDQDGLGIGPLFVDLALSRYAGPIVLTPSAPDQLPRWQKWLASDKPAGCGSAHAGDDQELDIRDVEPKDRLGTILGAFRALPRGGTLRITLDHDPSCMYYALEESEPPGSFDFRKLGDGPEVWHAEVTKVATAGR